jgi:hypothetical protein
LTRLEVGLSNHQFEGEYEILFEDFSEGLANVRVNGLWGYIDKSGAFSIKPQFDSARRFSNGLALVQIKKEYVYIDKGGKRRFR